MTNVSIAREVHAVYRTLQAAEHLPDWARKTALGQLVYAIPGAWSVIGITDAALQLIADTDFQTISSIGVQRAHLTQRAKVYGQMLERPMEFDEWFQLWSDTDKCVFSTKAENKKAVLSACWHDIDPAAGLFAATGYVAQFRPEVEGAFLRQLHAKVMT